MSVLRDDERALLRMHANRLAGMAQRVQDAVANIDVASEDGEHWVVVDNLRRMPEQAGQVSAEAGRLLYVAEMIENEASTRRIAPDK